MRRFIVMLAAIMALLLSTAASFAGQGAESGEKAKPESQAPKAVLAAFHKAYPNATVRDISQETKDGKTYFEIESMDSTQRRDLLYRTDGSVYEIEESVDVGNLPKEITSGLSAKFPNGKLQKAERITRGDLIQYEVLVENGEENLEVLVDSAGIVKSQSSINDEDEEADSVKSDEPDED